MNIYFAERTPEFSQNQVSLITCTTVDELCLHPVTTSCRQGITLPLTEPSCIHPRQGNSLELQTYLLLLLKWKTELLFKHYPQSEGCLHLLQSKDILVYTLGRSAIPSIVIYHTVPELQPNLNSKYSVRSKA